MHLPYLMLFLVHSVALLVSADDYFESCGADYADQLPDGWAFVQGKIDGDTIRNDFSKTYDELVAECEADSDCDGLTTRKYLKKNIGTDMTTWEDYYPDDPCHGFFLKGPWKICPSDLAMVLDDSWAFAPNKVPNSDTIGYALSVDLYVRMQACNESSTCAALTTRTYTKEVPDSFDTTTWADYRTDDACMGTFYKTCIPKTEALLEDLEASGSSLDESDVTRTELNGGSVMVDYTTNSDNNKHFGAACDVAGGEYMYQSFTAACTTSDDTAVNIIVKDRPRCYSSVCHAEYDSEDVAGTDAQMLFDWFALKATALRNSDDTITYTCTGTEFEESSTPTEESITGYVCEYETEAIMEDNFSLEVERANTDPSVSNKNFMGLISTEVYIVDYSSSDISDFSSECSAAGGTLLTLSTTYKCSDGLASEESLWENEFEITEYPICFDTVCDTASWSDAALKMAAMSDFADRMVEMDLISSTYASTVDCSLTPASESAIMTFLRTKGLYIILAVVAIGCAGCMLMYLKDKGQDSVKKQTI